MKKINQYSDAQLIELIRKKSFFKERAMSELWLRYSNKLYSYCYRKIYDYDLAQDIHQYAWTKLYETIQNTDKEIPIEKTLYWFAKNKLIDDERAKARNEKAYKEILNLDIDKFSILQIKEEDSKLEIIRLKSEMLETEQKESFQLKWFAGMTYQEIAEIQEEKIETIKKRCNRALEKIATLLSPKNKQI